MPMMTTRATSAGRAAAGLLLAAALSGCMMPVRTPGGGGGGGGGTTGGTVETSESAGALRAREVAELVNRHRAGRRCPALTWDDRAARVAYGHSEDMRRNRYFDHRSRDGRSPFDRLDAAGVRWMSAAENIAQNGGAPAAVVQAWLNSPGHRENIQNCAFTHHGVGVSGDRWTHVFYTPR
jgi:uncharacterized protein YkwD